MLQEAAVFLGLSYLVLLGGTFNGVVRTDLQTLNLLLLGVVGFVWLAWRVLSKEPFPRSGFGLPVILFVLAYGIATVLSSDPRRSAILLSQIIFYALLLYFVLDLRRNGWPRDIFVKSLLIVSVFVIFFGLLETRNWLTSWWAIRDGGSLLPPTTIRIRAFIGHPNFAAAFLNLVLPLGLMQLFNTNARIPRFALRVWTVIVIVLLYFTSSRGGWLGTATVLGTAALLVVVDRQIKPAQLLKEHRRRVIELAALTIVPAILITLIFQRQVTHPTHGSIAGSRTLIWGVALQNFMSDPISGTGPLTYGSAYAETGIIPPGLLLAHAHSAVFNIAAETGLIGLAALGFLAFGVARETWYRWREHAPGERHWLAAFIASLAGLAVHSLFDTPTTLPALTAIALVFLAWLPRSSGAPVRRGLGNALAVTSWLAMLAMIGFGLRSYLPLMDGLRAAAAGNWETAALHIDDAVERDPSLAYHWFQAGFTDGVLALDDDGQLIDSSHLSSAINKYETGLAIDPSYAVHWANLAMVRRAGGDIDGALSDLSQAIELTPLQPNFHLTLGQLLEQQENWDAAQHAYRSALDLDDALADELFFTLSPFRLSVLESYKAEESASTSIADQGWLALEERSFETAIERFSLLDPLNDPTHHLGRGLAYLGMGRLDEANEMLTIAEFIGGMSGWTGARIQNALGLVAAGQDDCDSALDHLEGARSILDQLTSFGYAAGRSTDYGLYVYNRQGLSQDLLPGFARTSYSEEILEGMDILADCYEQLGQESEALPIRLELQEVEAGR
ncbi:MAG: O-antigen ligase family protein [Anaerolineales bacterium]